MAFKEIGLCLFFLKVFATVSCSGEVITSRGKSLGINNELTFNDPKSINVQNDNQFPDRKLLNKHYTQKPTENKYPKKFIRIKLKKSNPSIEYDKYLMSVKKPIMIKERKPRSATYTMHNQPRTYADREILSNPYSESYSKWSSYNQGNYDHHERSQTRQYSINRYNEEPTFSDGNSQQLSDPLYNPYREPYSITRNPWGGYGNNNNNNNNNPNPKYNIDSESGYYGTQVNEQQSDYTGQQQVDEMDLHDTEYSQKELQNMAEMEEAIERELTKYYGNNGYSAIMDTLHPSQYENQFNQNNKNSYFRLTNVNPYPLSVGYNSQKEQTAPAKHSISETLNLYGSTNKNNQEFSVPHSLGTSELLQQQSGEYQKGPHEVVGQVQENLGEYPKEDDLGQKFETKQQKMETGQEQDLEQDNLFQNQQYGIGQVQDSTNVEGVKKNEEQYQEEMSLSQQHEEIGPYSNLNSKQNGIGLYYKETIPNYDQKVPSQIHEENNFGQVHEDIGQYEDQQAQIGQKVEDINISQVQEGLGQYYNDKITEQKHKEPREFQDDILGQVQESIGQFQDDDILGQTQESTGQFQADDILGQAQESIGQFQEKYILGQTQESIGQFQDDDILGQTQESIGQFQEDDILGQTQESIGQFQEDDILGQAQENIGQFQEDDILGQTQESIGQFQEDDILGQTQESIGQFHEDDALGQAYKNVRQYQEKSNLEQHNEELGQSKIDINFSQTQESASQYPGEIVSCKYCKGSGQFREKQYDRSQEQEIVGQYYKETESQQYGNLGEIKESDYDHPEYTKEPIKNTYLSQTHISEGKYQEGGPSRQKFMKPSSVVQPDRIVNGREENRGYLYARTTPKEKYEDTQSGVQHEDYYQNSYGKIKVEQKEVVHSGQTYNMHSEQKIDQNINSMKPVTEEVIIPKRVEDVGLEEKKAGRYKLIEQFLDELEKDIKINTPKETERKPLKQAPKSVYYGGLTNENQMKYHQQSNYQENYHSRVVREEKEVTTEKFNEDMFSDEDEKPSFWSNVGRKITDTYNKAKEKTKDLIDEVKDKISN